MVMDTLVRVVARSARPFFWHRRLSRLMAAASNAHLNWKNSGFFDGEYG